MTEKMLNYKTFFIVGAVMVIIGFIVPVLMVMDIMPKILWLQLLIGAFQMVGLILGLIGSFMYFKENRK